MAADASELDLLLVAYCPPTGAVAELFAGLAHDLAAIARVGVLAPESLRIDTPLAADVRFPYSTRRPDRAVLGAGWRAHRRAAALRPAAVLLFTQHPLNLLAAAHFRTTPLVFWWHEPGARGQVSAAKSLVYAANDKVIAPRSSAIVVAAPSVRDRVPARFRGKTSVVPFPANRADADSGRFAATPVDVLFFGKIEGYKGLDTLAAALDSMTSPRPTVRMVGAGDLAAAAPAMAAYVAANPQSAEHVDEYVSSADLSSALRSARVVVFPYLTAAGSSTLTIAAAHATPMIASRTGCFGDYLVDRRSALLFEPGHADQLATALTEALGDEALRRRLADEAAALVDTVFAPSHTSAQLMAIVRALRP